MAQASTIRPILTIIQRPLQQRYVHVSAALNKSRTARYKPTLTKDFPLTYEMANPPHFIGVRKSWNSWNTSSLLDAPRASETSVEDMFIRRFMDGTFPQLVAGIIIIKRQHNIVRICTTLYRVIQPYKIYFLVGYAEEFLSYWLHCPVKIEIVTVDRDEKFVYKYI